MKFVSADLSRPNLAEEGGYSGDGVIPRPARVRWRRGRGSEALPHRRMKVAAALGLESSSEGSEIERGKCGLQKVFIAAVKKPIA